MALRACVLGLALLGLAGCGSGIKKVPVSGTVTFNDTPLPEGRIIFEPADGKAGGDSGNIKDGKYDLKVKPGKQRVQILANREKGPKNPVMGAAPQEQYIPKHYNDKTTLSADVTEGGDNKFDFPLTDKR